MPGFSISIDVTEPDSWPAPSDRLEETVREAALAALELALAVRESARSGRVVEVA
jgi:hypothetical protein